MTHPPPECLILYWCARCGYHDTVLGDGFLHDEHFSTQPAHASPTHRNRDGYFCTATQLNKIIYEPA